MSLDIKIDKQPKKIASLSYTTLDQLKKDIKVFRDETLVFRNQTQAIKNDADDIAIAIANIEDNIEAIEINITNLQQATEDDRILVQAALANCQQILIDVTALKNLTEGFKDDAESAATQTALDAIATAADRVQTGLDVITTNADVVSSGINANVAEDFKDLSQAWAESSTAPSGVGTKSAKTWAEEANTIVSTVDGVSLAEIKVFNESIEKRTLNLFDKNGALPGVITSSGVYSSASTNWVCTQPIAVEPEINYAIQGYFSSSSANLAVAWYNSSMVFISGSALNGTANRTFTSPVNAAFVRCTIANAVGIGLNPTDNIRVNSFMIEEGNSYSTYEPFIPIGFIKPSSIFNPSELEVSNSYYSLDIDGYLGNEKFIVYIRISSNFYIGFELVHWVDMTDTVYTNQWRILLAREYIYSNNTMVLTGNNYLVDGDSEGVYRTTGKSDFVGGVHGDEILINVKFFANGVEIKNISSDIPLTPCKNFKLLQKSNTHEAPATGNIPNLSHPIETERIKEILFDKKGYEIFNRWTWINNPNTSIELFYHALTSTSKDASLEGYSDNDFNSISFTGTTSFLLASVGSRQFKANNEVKGISLEVNSKLLKPLSLDETCNMFIWDRATDSKYYRNINGAPSTAGSVIESIMTVTWNKQ